MNKIPQNKHKGQRCFVIASGPSTKQMDLSVLKNEITICVNESYKVIDFEPTYSCIGDRNLYPLIKDKLASMNSRIIASSGLNGQVGKDYPGNNLDALIKLEKSQTVKDDGFIWDMQKVYKAWNVVPELVLPFVCWCGFDECFLIGCDCNNAGYAYQDSVREKGTQHFYSEAMICYDAISKMTLPTKIYNATVGGQLESFPRVSLDEVITKTKTKTKSDLLAIGYYTRDRNYKELAERMKASVEKQGIECIIKERKSLATEGLIKPMPWVLNCSQCGSFIQEMREEYPNRPLLYLDADAIMQRRPRLFLDEVIDYDFAAVFLSNVHIKDELQSSTLFFNNTEKASKLLDDWVSLQKKRNSEMLAGQYSPPYFDAWDQRVLQKVLKDVKVKKLPYEYAKIALTPKGEELMKGVDPNKIVISQHQASRQNKVHV